MNKEEKNSSFHTKMDADFEQIAERIMVEISDNSEVLVLHTKAPENIKKAFNLIIIPGFASIVLGWDEFLMRAKDFFNIYYLETREKSSSILSKKSKYTVDRISSDIGEMMGIFGLKPQKTILFGSSFGSIIAADAVNMKKVKPFLTIFVGPPYRIEMPPAFRYLLFIVPAFVYRLFAPIGKYWIRKSKSESPKQAARYIRVIDEGDPRKWKKFLTRLAFDKYWESYAGIESKVLVIDESEDKMHQTRITKKITSSIADCEIVDLKTNEFTHSAGFADFLYEKVAEYTG